MSEAPAATRRLDALEAENTRLSKLLGLLDAYHAAASEPPDWARPAKQHRHGRAICNLLLSDLHLDEVCNPHELGGLNAYNREVAELRLRRWADQVARLAAIHKHDWDGCNLLVDGDLVSGAIHDELRESNSDVLPGTLVHWAPLLASAFKVVAATFKRVHVSVVVGNHGRLTIRKQFKRRGRASWDWLLMQMVRSHMAADKRLSWEFAEGSYLFPAVYGRRIFLTHGDEVGGGGGWAGVWSPLGTIHRRGIALGAAHGCAPSYSAIGHWHQLTLAPQRGLICNSSLKGWDEFAAGLRLTPEPAQQAMWIEHPRHGPIVLLPVLCEDRKREGW